MPNEKRNMSKKTLIIILGLLFIPAVFLVMSFFQHRPTNSTTTITPPAVSSIPTPTPSAQTTLLFSPNPLIIASPSGSLAISIDTGENKVNAVQIELSYDPNTLANVDITPGTFFSNPTQLLNTIDAKNGKASYVLAISPSGKAQSGRGTVAVVSFKTKLPSGQKTTITFTPKTLVTAENVATSVLKATDMATIFYVRQQVGTTEQTPIGPIKPQ